MSTYADVCKHLRGVISDAGRVFESRDADGQMALAVFRQLREHEIEPGQIATEIDPAELGISWEDLLEKASTDRAAYKLLALEATEKLKYGELTGALKQFAISVLAGELHEPTRTARRRKHAERNHFIAHCVFLATSHGLKTYRNREKDGAHESACDAVSEMLRELLGVIITYENVAVIWGNDAVYRPLADELRSLKSQDSNTEQ